MSDRFNKLGFLVLGAVALAAVGCGDSGDTTGGGIDCETATIKGYDDLTIFSTCTECHDSTKTDPAERQAAPVDINYDSYEAAKKDAQTGVDYVKTGDCPPAPAPAPSDAEIADFEVWAACGTPETTP